jgi:anti-anti-sigma factor
VTEIRLHPTPDLPSPQPFRVDVLPDRNRVVVAPHGELDLATVDELRDEIDALAARGFQRIVVDLRALDFMDSTGLRLMLQQCNRTDATVALIDGAAPVSAIFDVTRTRAHLRFEEHP